MLPHEPARLPLQRGIVVEGVLDETLELLEELDAALLELELEELIPLEAELLLEEAALELLLEVVWAELLEVAADVLDEDAVWHW